MKMITSKQKEILDHSCRYENFTILKQPMYFDELFSGRDIPNVGLHSIETIGNDEEIIGFCGCFSWKDGKVISLDGDSYTKKTIVYGYEEWEHLSDNNNIEHNLDILVWDEW